MDLVALLSIGKGTWGQVAGLVNRGEWDKIVLIGNDFAKKNFSYGEKVDFIKVDFNRPIKESITELRDKLRGKFNGTEIALSIASGLGREHMILISSLIQVPVGIKFTALIKDGIIFF